MKRFTLFILIIAAVLCSCSEKTEKRDIYNYIKTLDDLDNYIIVGTYKGVEVETIDVTDDDVEERINDILKKNSYYKKIDKTTVASGDCVHISYVSYLDGKEFDGGAAEDDLVVGSGKYEFKEVESALAGMNVGDKKEINVNIPQDYYSVALQGKTIIMEVTVTQIQENIVPTLTVDFVKGNYKVDTINAFKTIVREQLEQEAKDTMYTNAWDKVLENCEIIVYPDGLIEEYVSAMREHYTEEAEKVGAELEYIVGDVEAWEQEAPQYAMDYYKSEMAMYYILDKEIGREVSSEEYSERVKIYADKKGITVDELKKQYTKDKLITSIHWNKVMEFVWENAVKI